MKAEATGIQIHEMIREADDNIDVYRGLDFGARVRICVSAKRQSNIGNAAMFGFKAYVEF